MQVIWQWEVWTHLEYAGFVVVAAQAADIAEAVQDPAELRQVGGGQQGQRGVVVRHGLVLVCLARRFA